MNLNNIILTDIDSERFTTSKSNEKILVVTALLRLDIKKEWGLGFL